MLAEMLRDELLADLSRDDSGRAHTARMPASAGKRALRNLCLGYLMEPNTRKRASSCIEQFSAADNMTDAMAALTCSRISTVRERTRALEAFYERWKDEPLVVDKWLRVQAISRLPGTLAE